MTATGTLTPERVICPACKRSVMVTRSGLHAHGPNNRRCPGQEASICYRYRVTDSNIDEVPAGTHLLYGRYRGPESQQSVLQDGKVPGGWAMEFMDVGVKYRSRFYDLEGNTEADE